MPHPPPSMWYVAAESTDVPSTAVTDLMTLTRLVVGNGFIANKAGRIETMIAVSSAGCQEQVDGQDSGREDEGVADADWGRFRFRRSLFAQKASPAEERLVVDLDWNK